MPARFWRLSRAEQRQADAPLRTKARSDMAVRKATTAAPAAVPAAT